MEMKKLVEACKLWKMMIAKWDDDDGVFTKDDIVKNQTVLADLYDDRTEKCDHFNFYVPRKPRSQVCGRSNHKQQINGYVFQEISRNPKKRSHEVESSFGSSNRPKKAAKKRRVVGIRRQLAPQLLLPNPPLPQNMKDYIEHNLKLVGPPPLFVANKVLKKTDLNRGESRLSFPESRVDAEFINNFLTDRERADLQNKMDIEVRFVDERLQEYHDLYLKRWSLTSSSLYVFKRGWNKMVEENKFRADEEIVQVWAFRVEERLWFALFTTPAN